MVLLPAGEGGDVARKKKKKNLEVQCFMWQHKHKLDESENRGSISAQWTVCPENGLCAFMGSSPLKH